MTEEPVDVVRDGVRIDGVLDVPKSKGGPWPSLLIIAGSGPTDRDGNSPMGLCTDAYKELAAALASRGVVTLRYDKRGIGASDRVDEDKLTMGDFVEDARALVLKLRSDPRLSSVGVVGHSEGGLVALLLAQSTHIDGLALVATPGRTLGAVLREQLARQLDASTMRQADRLIDAIRSGGAIEGVPKGLEPVFRPSVAPFLRSILDVDPTSLLPSAMADRVAVIQGDMDLQVTVDADARRLSSADRRAHLFVLPGVAHTLKHERQRRAPQRSYSDPSRPIAPEVVEAVLSIVRAE